jgi:uncharacterized damage-inducible protein DinB
MTPTSIRPMPAMPEPTSDERELLLRYLHSQRDAVLRKTGGISDHQARWRPDGRLISLIGIVNHLTHVEWRWIEGGYLRRPVSRSEEEFAAEGLVLSEVVEAYRKRAAFTDATVREAPDLDAPCQLSSFEGIDLRWVLLHLIEETARHAGHADATRELLDGTRGL